MKKILSALISLSLLCALTACGGQPQNGGSNFQPSAPTQSQPAPSQPDASAEEPPTGTDSSEHGAGSDGGILIAYFSATGNTRPVAELMAGVLEADLYEIVPEDPYTDADLNYNTDCRANDEQNDPNARPAISGEVENMEQYDTILLGYPIWWGQAPKIIYTFLESYDLGGKTIVPFCTSGSSGLGSSASNLHNLASNATWMNGQRFSGSASHSTVESWINGLDLTLTPAA